MGADISQSSDTGWLVTIGVGVVTAFGGFVVALVNRSPALQGLVDSRLRTLIDGYEKRIDDLTHEVATLRAEVISLRHALDDSRDGVVRATRHLIDLPPPPVRADGDPNF